MNEMQSLKLIFVVNLVILLSHIDGKRACLEEERIGLLELKSFLMLKVLNGSDHVPSWVDEQRSDCCGWDRVTCNSTTGRLHMLSLFNIRESNLNYFSCPHDFYWNISLFQSFEDLKTLNLSYSCIQWKDNQGLLRLQKLETLDLTFNSLTSSGLQSLKELKSLKNLFLSYNSINGSFPARELSVFENLETLDLSRNRLTDSPTNLDSANLSKLQSVMLSGNALGIDIMRLMGSLPSLKSLNLSHNSIGSRIGARGTLSDQDLITFGRLEVLDLSVNFLDGGIPQNIGKLSSLRELYLESNGFNASLSVQGLCELRRLEVLDIHGNRFRGTLPSCLSNLTSLTILDLHDNRLSGPIAPNSIRALNFLQFIDVSNNYFEGSFSFSSLFNHSKLELVVLGGRDNKLRIDNDDRAGIPLFQLKVLQLSNCSMKGSPHFLLNQHRLTWVDISHNKFSGAFPSWLLENNSDLKFLNLRNNSFTGKLDPLPRKLMSNMIHMDVSYNHIDGYLPKDLGITLPNLQYLDLSYNFFEGDLPPSVGAMTNLFLLDLSFNKLTGEVPQEMVKNCTDLEVLILNNNKFHGEFFSTHYKLNNLLVLRLGNNEFTGSLITIGKFTIRIFDVCNNKMTGKIPNGIAADVVLLQNNSFEGRIPCEGFIGAQVLDISHNRLSGPIPSCLLSKVSSNILLLNLRDNRLSGNIPAQLGDVSSLRILLLGNNHFDGSIPRQLCELRDIGIMDLSNNALSGSIPSCLSKLAFGNDSHDFSELLLPYRYSMGATPYDFLDLLQEIYDSSSFGSFEQRLVWVNTELFE